MNIGQLISPVPTLKPEDNGNKALDLMDENKLNELPVVADDNYVALVREDDILDWDKPHLPLGESDLVHFKPAVAASAHPFDALRIVHDLNLSVLPVLDNAQKYVGAVTRDGLLRYLAENSGIDKAGGILVLEILPRNYTLYEIARICENEDVMVQNLQVHTLENGVLEVTLKLNRVSLDAVIASFERHNYHVKEVYGQDVNNEDLQEKYNLLMNYLNM